MSSPRKLNINGTPNKFDLMSAYFQPVNNSGPTICLSTGDTPNSKSFWTATVRSCIPIDGSREMWLITGYISRGIGSMQTDSRPYEAVIQTDRPKGWLKVLDGEITDHKVHFSTFDELAPGSHFLLVDVLPRHRRGLPASHEQK